MNPVSLDRGDSPGRFFRLVWSVKSRTLVTSSVLADGLVIIADGSRLLALDRNTGRSAWEAAIAANVEERLGIHAGLVWALDLTGRWRGFDVSDGRCHMEHQLAYGGWGVQYHGGSAYFINRASRPLIGRNGVASRIDLSSGEVHEYTKGVTADGNGYKNNTRVVLGEEAVVFFAAPEIVKFSMGDGCLLEKYPLPGCSSLSGLAVLDGAYLGIARRDARPGRPYSEANPRPLVWISEAGLAELPLSARGDLPYVTSVLSLPSGGRLIEVAESLFMLNAGTVEPVLELPRRGVWGNNSAGAFRVDETVVVFQRDRAEGDKPDHLLNVYLYEPATRRLSAATDPLVTNPVGKRAAGASVDQYDDLFLIRADGRCHCLAWAA